jgi:hypothetical protein
VSGRTSKDCSSHSCPGWRSVLAKAGYRSPGRLNGQAEANRIRVATKQLEGCGDGCRDGFSDEVRMNATKW